MKAIDYIVSAKHYGGSGKGYIKKQQEAHRRRGVSVNIKDMDKPIGAPVFAEIWQGQWIARCEDCNGASFIDPDEPVFFCFGCGNRMNGGSARPVIVPDNWSEIERVILERPVNDVAGLTDLERAGMAKPVLHIEKDIDGKPAMLPLSRSWKHGETIQDLHEQQDDAIRRWKLAKDNNDGL